MFDAIINFFVKNSDTILLYSFKIPAVFIALTIHEFAHSVVAYLLGDPTAKEDGRLSLNPFKHFEPIGAICLYLFQIGWAKPVSTNAKNFKNERIGIVLTSLSGPIANILTFVISLAFMNIIAGIMYLNQGTLFFTFLAYLLLFTELVALYNFALGFFNLFPIFPLDASRALMAVLPKRISKPIVRYNIFIAIGFIALLIIDRFTLQFVSGTIGFVFNHLGNSVFLPFFEKIVINIMLLFKLV
jgi:Zn-dependent protease